MPEYPHEIEHLIERLEAVAREGRDLGRGEVAASRQLMRTAARTLRAMLDPHFERLWAEEQARRRASLTASEK
jgi:hypothetical protein